MQTGNSNLLINTLNQGNLRAVVDGLAGDIKTAVKESVPVQQLINTGVKRTNIESTLSILISKFAQMLSVGGNLKEGQSIEIAKMLIQDYPTLGLDDFNVMLSRGVRGRYGEIFRFDVSVVFSWALAYMDEWAEEREKLMDKVIEPEPAEKTDIHKPKVDVDKMLADHLETLRDTKMKGVPTLTKKEIREEGQSEPPRKKATASAQYLTTPEQAREKELKIEWARLHTDLYTGKVKEGSPSFHEWAKQQTI